MLYDVFICHASDDKQSLVRPLAEGLRAKHIEVWYDEFTLELGDSIRRAIDRGLRQSRFGIVILSKAFFEKGWTQYELDALVERETSARAKVILPVWHGVSHDEVAEYSQALAGKRAARSDDLEQVISEIVRVIHPAGSPLLIARDIVIEWGGDPPVITDRRWLETVEASNRVPAFGAVPSDHSTWDRWSFPLPPRDGAPEAWGERLAWSYMQLEWTEAAEEREITPLSDPSTVHDFLREFPGLMDAAAAYPDLLIEYAPQLSIPGFEGDPEAEIEAAYQKSVDENSKRASAPKTVCDEEWALRHPTFGGMDPVTVAYAYFAGGMFGPPVLPYEHADHLIWLLSDSSEWLPPRLREYLTDGMSQYIKWPWDEYEPTDQNWPTRGALSKLVDDCIDRRRKFRWSEAATDDLRNRIKKTCELLRLRGSPEQIAARFVERDVVAIHIEHRREFNRRRHAPKSPA